MTADVIIEFRRRPSVLAYMLRGLYPSPGVHGTGGGPAISARWRSHRVDRRHLAEFLQLSGLRADPGMPILFPHVFSFPLQMAVLTHPRFPMPFWKVLQIRNHLLQHRSIFADTVLDLETRVVGRRILEKGVEFDLHTSISARQELVWESLNTFYYRGRYGQAGAASPLARAPRHGDTQVARWRTAAAASGWGFAALTGDYNGIHYWHWYARRLGFRRAFLPPQLVLGQCMARLSAPQATERQRLDVWLKGPVYTDAGVRLNATTESDRTVFGLSLDGEERPAILASWRSGEVAGPLFDSRPAASRQLPATR
jgi:acyl dehydratase